MEVSVATLAGRSTEFPTDASLSDFFKWFRKEIELMPTAFTEFNENITCYALIGIFQMLAGEGCEHLTELKILAHSCDASILQNFPMETGRIAKKAHEELVKFAWSAILYAKNRGRKPGEFWYVIFGGKFLCVI
jgi:hypothetical protein